MLVVILGLQALGIIVLILVWQKVGNSKSSVYEDLTKEMQQLRLLVESGDRSLKDDLQRTRNDLLTISNQSRDELRAQIADFTTDQSKAGVVLREEIMRYLESISNTISQRLLENRDELRMQISDFTAEQGKATAMLREEIMRYLESISNTISQRLLENRDEQRLSLSQLADTQSKEALSGREELIKSFSSFSQNLSMRMQEQQKDQLNQYEALKSAIEAKLNLIQDNNEKKLEQMRQTVDEKLHDTLEKRLGESFKQVSERLEQVHKGLGEMQNLATGVGDLKKVLSNVKTRGVMGEIQLQNLLEQLLTPEQYEINFRPYPKRDEMVEFAIKLPGKDDGEAVYMAIDAKFPVEDYHRLSQAYEDGDLPAIDQAQKQLLKRIKECARDIKDKYIAPPRTTDFALLFLPFEGLYAEVLRHAGTFEQLQRDYHVIVVGPTTLAAILNSLQLGFRTLAIEKRSSEVWKILSAIKLEFSKFGDVLTATQKKLQQAGDAIEKASFRSKQIQKRLGKVQEMPLEDSKAVLELEENESFLDTDDEGL